MRLGSTFMQTVGQVCVHTASSVGGVFIHSLSVFMQIVVSEGLFMQIVGSGCVQSDSGVRGYVHVDFGDLGMCSFPHPN